MTAIALSSFRTAALNKADMLNTQFMSVSELNAIVNEELAELYDLLIGIYEDWFVASETFTLTAPANSYALANGALKIRAVDKDNGNFNLQTVDSMNYADRNRRIPSRSGAPVRFVILGQNLTLFPQLNTSGNYVVEYVPVYTPLVADSDMSFDIPNGWEAMVYAGSAAKCLSKEESDPSVQLGIKAATKARIMAIAANRDASGPSTISFVRSGRCGAVNPLVEPYDGNY